MDKELEEVTEEVKRIDGEEIEEEKEEEVVEMEEEEQKALELRERLGKIFKFWESGVRRGR